MTEERAKLPCAEKQAFDSGKQAQTAATVAYFQRGVRLKIYRCNHCQLWHLSSVYSDGA
jgi:hypothetical protein